MLLSSTPGSDLGTAASLFPLRETFPLNGCTPSLLIHTQMASQQPIYLSPLWLHLGARGVTV